MPKINQGIVNNSLFPLPPYQEQKQIVNKTDELLDYINLLQTQTEKNGRYADKLMQAVLREVFEG